MQQKQIVAVYGGSFDPVHIGHQNIVRSLLKKRVASEVWVVPCAKRADKIFKLTDDERMETLKQVFADLPQVKLQRTELDHGALIPTYELITLYHGKYPQREFAFVIGSDLLKELPTWKHPKELVKEVHFIICNRAGYIIDPATLPAKHTIVDVEELEVSSTHVMEIVNDATLSPEEKQKTLEKYLRPQVIQLLHKKGMLE